MITYLSSFLICISLFTNTNVVKVEPSPKKEVLTKNFEYKVKTFKVKELEYKRVPTKWIKETPAN